MEQKILVLNPSDSINNISSGSKSLHYKYSSLFILESLVFLVFGYYLCYTAKHHIKKIKQLSETSALYSKYEVFKNLAIANCIRGISIIYMIISLNKSDDDIISFINYFCHVFPTLLFISVFFSYIRFLIEKYYEIKIKKKDIFFTPSLNFFNILIYILMSIITLASLMLQAYKSYMYISLGIISILYLILSWFYLYFGVNLSSYYSKDNSSRKETDSKERELIRNKILLISLVLGIMFLARGIFSFLICVKTFDDVYPTFMNINIWDSLVFFFTELLCAYIIGSTKQREEKDKRADIEFKQQNIPNFNNEIVVGNIMEEFNNIHEPLMYQVEKKV